MPIIVRFITRRKTQECLQLKADHPAAFCCHRPNCRLTVTHDFGARGYNICSVPVCMSKIKFTSQGITRAPTRLNALPCRPILGCRVCITCLCLLLVWSTWTSSDRTIGTGTDAASLRFSVFFRTATEYRTKQIYGKHDSRLHRFAK